MMDDSAPIHDRKKLVKTYKNVLPQKRTMVAKVCGDLLQKMINSWSRKTAMDVKYTLQNKGERWERDLTVPGYIVCFKDALSPSTFQTCKEHDDEAARRYSLLGVTANRWAAWQLSSWDIEMRESFKLGVSFCRSFWNHELDRTFIVTVCGLCLLQTLYIS